MNNMLNHKQSYELTKWLDERREDARRQTDAALAEAATVALGFSVTGNNVYSARATIGLRKNAPSADGLTAIRQDLVTIADAVRRYSHLCKIAENPTDAALERIIIAGVGHE